MHNHGCVSSLELPLDLFIAASLVGAETDRRVVTELEQAGLPGIRRGHGYLIQRLVEQPATVGEIAASLEISQQAVSKTVGELVRLGYVEQTTDPEDRRRRPVRLSRRGRRAVAVARTARRDLRRRLEDEVGPRRLAAAERVLAAAAQVLGMAEQVATRTVRPARDDL
jgi:DNA-binding MarR family transcriptional regulator